MSADPPSEEPAPERPETPPETAPTSSSEVPATLPSSQGGGSSSRDLEPPRASLFSLAKWLFLLVPAVGILELLAHIRQVTNVVPDADWAHARDEVKAQIRPDDEIVFAPSWTDPIGRETFGDELMTLEREARPDDSRFARAFEISIRGKHAAELEGWREVARKNVGAITIRTLENPSPQKPITDLVSRVGASTVTVTRNDQPCNWSHASAQTGNLGFGPAVPADRFQCTGGGFVGVSVVPVLDYSPRRCIFAPPSGGNGVLRMTFHDVAFGHALRGHHALYVEAERMKHGAPVTLAFKVDDRVLGSFVHADGDGWKPFEFDTGDLAGTTKDLTVEVTSTDGADRRYCFEGVTQ